MGFEFPDLTPDSVELLTTIKQDSVKKDNRKPKNIEEITRKFENEEACLQTLRQLDEAEVDVRKRIVYFSCLKGQVLQRLKEISGRKMNELLKLTNYS